MIFLTGIFLVGFLASIPDVLFPFGLCYEIPDNFKGEGLRPSIYRGWCIMPDVFSIAAYIGTVLVAIYIIRRWSAQWNAGFSTPAE